MIKLDIILQGQYSPFTETIIKEYASLPFVHNIILSSYDIERDDIDVIVANNVMIDPPGVGNRNLQINTTRRGLEKVVTNFCIKMRTDQLIRPHSMKMMYDFWIANKQEYRIFVLGMYRDFPYHPRDHVFWGSHYNLCMLFDIPFDTNTNPDYTKNVRAETYIGQYYYALFDSSIETHINCPQEYLYDSAPRIQEALAKDFAIRDQVFMPFPKVSMAWPKFGLNEYHYHVGASLSEYWSD